METHWLDLDESPDVNGRMSLDMSEVSSTQKGRERCVMRKGNLSGMRPGPYFAFGRISKTKAGVLGGKV